MIFVIVTIKGSDKMNNDECKIQKLIVFHPDGIVTEHTDMLRMIIKIKDRANFHYTGFYNYIEDCRIRLHIDCGIRDIIVTEFKMIRGWTEKKFER